MRRRLRQLGRAMLRLVVLGTIRFFTRPLVVPAAALWRWLDERGGFSELFGGAIKHPIPARLQGRIGWFWALGIATLTAFIVQGATGLALATVYIPSPADAYDSIRFIDGEKTLGWLVRGMHFYGASAVIVLIVAHMLRVLLTGSYKYPRELSWLTGVGLLIITLGLAFTGQLLRWDQDSIGSVFVASDFAGRVPVIGGALVRLILAGEHVGGATLARFYALHVFILPLLLVALVAMHLWLVLRNGISEPPDADRPVSRRSYREWYERHIAGGPPYFPDMAWREAVLGLGVVLAVVALAVLFGPPPLGPPADPTLTDVDPRPDWYFYWLFALFSLSPPALESVVIVVGPLVVLIVLVLLPLLDDEGQRHPLRRPWAVAAAGLLVLTFGGLTYSGSRAEWTPEFAARPLGAAELGEVPEQVLEGARLFHVMGCQYCHTVAGEGGTIGRDLTGITHRLSTDDIRVRILAPPPGMPSYADTLTREELEAIMAFLIHLGERAGEEPP